MTSHDSDAALAALARYLIACDDALHTLDVTRSELRVGFCLCVEKHPWNVRQLSEATGVSHPTVLKIIRGFVKRGLIVQRGRWFEITEGFLAEERKKISEFKSMVDVPMRGLHDALGIDIDESGKPFPL